jgi:hypothetical protein
MNAPSVTAVSLAATAAAWGLDEVGCNYLIESVTES